MLLNIFRFLRAKIILLSILSIALVVPTFADLLKPFESDGCSSFPDGTYYDQSLWYECCKAHDYAYWRGGTHDERLQADEDLRVCVAELGQPEVAFIMLMGVRVGGVPWMPTEFRWGYGWSYPKSYGSLTEGELALIEALGGEKERLFREGSKIKNAALSEKSDQTQPLVIPDDHKVRPKKQ